MARIAKRAPRNARPAPRAPEAVADDLLRGADAIAEFVFGDRRHRRKVYYLTSVATHPLPHFRIGAHLCARRSALRQWLADLEACGGSPSPTPPKRPSSLPDLARRAWLSALAGLSRVRFAWKGSENLRRRVRLALAGALLAGALCAAAWTPL